jgi:hypothetical protein
MARLGDILVAIGAVQEPQVREALDGQVIYGGRLGTNLLEMGAVSEENLAQGLGRQHRCPALAGEIGVEQQALGLLKADRVDRLEAVPLRMEGRRLVVLVRDPRDLGKLDELSFATGKEVRAVVVAESRLFELMRRHYGVHRPMRGVEAVASRMVRQASPERVAGAEAGPDLMDEADFAALYDHTGTGRTPAPVPLAAAPTPAPVRPSRPTPPPLPRRDAFHGALVSTEEVLAALQIDAEKSTDRDGRGISLSHDGGADAPPLSFDEAVQALAGVEDREAIALVVLRCARSHFRRAVLLTVRGPQVHGWEGLGVGLTPQTVARVHVGLDHPGVFQTVVQSQAHFLGPLQKTEANVRFLRALGGGAPRNSFAMPILARGQVVNVLYGDNGRGELVDAGGIGDLLILATKISHSYDVLLARAR